MPKEIRVRIGERWYAVEVEDLTANPVRVLVDGELVEVASQAGGAIRPALSLDGRGLVYGSRHDGQTGYRLRDLEADTETWLTYPVQHDLQENNWMGTSTDHMPGYAFTIAHLRRATGSLLNPTFIMLAIT